MGVANALKNFDPRVVKQAGELAKQLVEVLAQKYGSKRAYLGGPGRVDRGRRRHRYRARAARRQDQIHARRRRSSRARRDGNARERRRAHDRRGIDARQRAGHAAHDVPGRPQLGMERIVASLDASSTASPKSSTTSTPRAPNCWAHNVVIARALAAVAAVATFSAFAQSYPAKPVRLVVPFPAGGGSDVVGRIVAQKLGERVGQQVIVDNRAARADRSAPKPSLNHRPMAIPWCSPRRPKSPSIRACTASSVTTP